MLRYITDIRGKTRLADVATDGTATEITDSDGIARTIFTKTADKYTEPEPATEPDPPAEEE